MSPKTPSRPGQLGTEALAIIRESMGRERITQADITRSTGIPQSTVSRILGEKTDLPIDAFDVISRAVRLDPAHVLAEASRRLSEPTATVTPLRKPPTVDDLRGLDAVADRSARESSVADAEGSDRGPDLD